jgi:hypothetical protein
MYGLQEEQIAQYRLKLQKNLDKQFYFFSSSSKKS